MSHGGEQTCPDCGGASRRDFLKHTIGGIAAAGAVSSGLLSVVGPSRRAMAAAPITPAGAASETLVAQLYKSLTDDQKKIICFPFDHALRLKVDNNWHIIKDPITKVFDKDQQALVRDIFRDIPSE